MLDSLSSIAAVLVLWVLVAMPISVLFAGFCALNSRFDEWEPESGEEDNEVRKAA